VGGCKAALVVGGCKAARVVGGCSAVVAVRLWQYVAAEHSAALEAKRQAVHQSRSFFDYLAILNSVVMVAASDTARALDGGEACNVAQPHHEPLHKRTGCENCQCTVTSDHSNECDNYDAGCAAAGCNGCYRSAACTAHTTT
jgi:hypothetical protein